MNFDYDSRDWISVITFNVEHVKEELIVITLLTIYDKSEMVSVSDSYIKQLVLSIIE